MDGAALPDDADPQAAQGLQFLAPVFDQIRFGLQVGDLRRDGVEPRLQQARQAQQGGTYIAGTPRLALDQQPIDSRNPLEQAAAGRAGAGTGRYAPRCCTRGA